jgi:hypothetical protein
MYSLKQKFDDNYLLGCIKFREKSNLYLMPIGWWILNYQKYDPTYNPSDWSHIYRGNVLNVSEDQIENFFKAIEDDKIEVSILKVEIDKISSKYFRVQFYIDFDKKIFVNGYRENIEIETYLPDNTWKGFLGEPIEYIPNELKLF